MAQILTKRDGKDVYVDDATIWNNLPTARQTARMSRKAFIIRAFKAGVVTQADAIAFVGGAALPAFIDAAIDASAMTADEKLEAKADILIDQEIKRLSPLVTAIQDSLGLTDAQLDGLFA